MKKSVRTMDVCLVVCAVLLVAFTIAMLRTFWMYGAIPDTLCTCFFAAIAGECGCLGWIKTTKERMRERNWQNEDYERMMKERDKNDGYH